MGPDPSQLVLLTTAKTEFEAEAIATSLRAEGVPAAVFSAAARTMQWEAGYQPGAQISVRAGDLEAAVAVLRRERRERGRIDWSSVDVGEFEGEESLPTPGPRVGGLSPRLALVRQVGVASLILMNVMWMVPSGSLPGFTAALGIAGVMILLRGATMRSRGAVSSR